MEKLSRFKIGDTRHTDKNSCRLEDTKVTLQDLEKSEHALKDIEKV